jgi:hypothetical protein
VTSRAAPLRTVAKSRISDPRKLKAQKIPPTIDPSRSGCESSIRTALPAVAATFPLPTALPPATVTLVRLPSATRFLACAAAAALGPAGPSGTAGRFAVAAAEDKRREVAVVDILTAGYWRGGPGSRQRRAVELGKGGEKKKNRRAEEECRGNFTRRPLDLECLIVDS